MYGQYELDEADGQVVKLSLVCNAFVSIAKCIWFKLQNVLGPNCQMYLSKMQNVFVQNAKWPYKYKYINKFKQVVKLGSAWVKNNNPQYGEMEQAPMNNRQLSQVQVKDRNPDYDSL